MHITLGLLIIRFILDLAVIDNLKNYLEMKDFH